MMRVSKYLCIVFIALLPTILFAGSADYYSGVSGVEAGGGLNYSLLWTGDHGSGTTWATISGGGGTKNGTLTNGVIADSTGDAWEEGSSTDHDGIYTFDADSTDDRLSFANSADDIIDSNAEGSLTIYVYLDDMTTDNAIWEMEGDVTNKAKLYVNSNGTVTTLFYCDSGGSGGIVSMTTTATVSQDTWTKITLRWSATYASGGGAGEHIGIRIGAGSWEYDADADEVIAFTTAISYTAIGEYGAGQNISGEHLDDLRMWKTYNGYTEND